MQDLYRKHEKYSLNHDIFPKSERVCEHLSSVVTDR